MVCAWARESMWEATASDSLLAIYGTAIKQPLTDGIREVWRQLRGKSAVFHAVSKQWVVRWALNVQCRLQFICK